MSNRYRDDNTENAAASDRSWGGLSNVTGEIAVLGATLLFGLGVSHDGGAALAGDQYRDAIGTQVEEAALAGDRAPSHLIAANLLQSRAVVADRAIPVLRVLHADSAVAGDTLVRNSSGLTSADAATAGDAVLASRHARSSVASAARAADAAWQAAHACVVDHAVATDMPLTSASGTHAADDAASVQEAFSGILRASVVITESAGGEDLLTRHLRAPVCVEEWAEAHDSGMQPRHGVAWVANTRNWAMSRYEPFDFHSIVAIDDVIYVAGEDGIYALDGKDETITATLTTGQMDVGQGQLAHLSEAYLAYELDGNASMTVSQTQAGKRESYTYRLPDKPADTLTTGRIQFGRGLRGRHFSFSLQLTGKAGYINDLRVSTQPVKRRV